MQVSVETTEGLERKMTVELPKDEINQEIGKRLQDLVKKVKINGFRPGKVPLSVVKKRYGGSVRQEVMSDQIQNSYYQALQQEKLKAAGYPKIDVSEDNEFAYTAVFEVYPTVKPADMKGAEIEKQTASVSDVDVDNMVNKLRERSASWNAVEREAADGDQVDVDFKGTIEGETFEGGEGSGMKVKLGSKQMIAGFEDGLIGKSAGNSMTLDLTFPEDYHAKDLAGKPVQFEITLNAVEEVELPEVDEAFMKSLGVESNDIDAFKIEIRQNLERELEQKLSEKIKNQVMDLLVEKNPIDLPSGLVEMEIDALITQTKSMSQMSGDIELPREIFKEQASRRVVIGLVLSEIVNDNDITVDQDAVQAKIASFAESYENPQQMIDYYNENEEQRRNVETLVLEEQVVDWAMGQANITEKAVDFDSVVDSAGNA